MDTVAPFPHPAALSPHTSGVLPRDLALNSEPYRKVTTTAESLKTVFPCTSILPIPPTEVISSAWPQPPLSIGVQTPSYPPILIGPYENLEIAADGEA